MITEYRVVLRDLSLQYTTTICLSLFNRTVALDATLSKMLTVQLTLYSTHTPAPIYYSAVTVLQLGLF